MRRANAKGIDIEYYCVGGDPAEASAGPKGPALLRTLYSGDLE
jgi:hypothetical protein